MKGRSSSRPVICQVLHSMDIGGAEVLADGLARALRKRYQFVFACLDELGPLGEKLQADGFPVTVLERRTPGVDWKCGFRLAAFLKEHQVSVIHAHQYTPFFQALVSRLSYRRPPIIFTEHGRHFPDTRSSKRVAVNRLFLRSDDRFFGVGQSVRDALIENEGLPGKQTEVIYNGVKIGPFAAVRNDEGQRRAARTELGLKPDDFAVLQVARLNPLKDHATALRAIERIVNGQFNFATPNSGSLDENIQLLLVGDGEERDSIEHAIRSRAIDRHVQLLGARRDIPKLLAAADVFLLSSVSEGVPLTLIEAMAAGVPIVSTDPGGIREVVADGESGLLTRPGDDCGLAERIAELTSTSLRMRLSQNAASTAKERFSLKRMHLSYSKVYDELSGRKLAKKKVASENRELGTDDSHFKITF